MNTTNHSNPPKLATEGKTIPWAAFYDTLVNIVSFGKARQLRHDIAAQAPYIAGDKVLDVGCGTGDQAILAKETVGAQGEVYGSDASAKMIEIAQQKAATLKTAINFQVDLIENVSHPNETFDVVMNSLVMHHLPDALKAKGIKEFYRTLKPGGHLYIVDMEPDGEGSFFKRLTDIIIHLHGGSNKLQNNVQGLIPLLEQAGFRDIKIGRVNRQLAYICAMK